MNEHPMQIVVQEYTEQDKAAGNHPPLFAFGNGCYGTFTHNGTEYTFGLSVSANGLKTKVSFEDSTFLIDITDVIEATLDIAAERLRKEALFALLAPSNPSRKVLEDWLWGHPQTSKLWFNEVHEQYGIGEKPPGNEESWSFLGTTGDFLDTLEGEEE